MSDICRTCLTKKEEMILIFNQDKSPLIIDMIMSISSVEFIPNDNLPSQMCITCFDTLKIAYNFKEQVISSNNELQKQARSKLLPLQAANFEKVEIKQEADHFYNEEKAYMTISDTNEHISVAKFALNADDPRSNYPEPLSSIDPLSETPIESVKVEPTDRCEDVDMPGASASETFSSHFDETYLTLGEDDDIFVKSEENFETTPQQIMYTNNTADNDFGPDDNLPLCIHVNTGCHESQVQQISNENSNLSSHSQNRTYAMNSELSAYEESSKASQGDKPPYKCTHCNEQFNSKGTFKSHVNKHTSPHKCDLCDETFGWPSDLKRHMRKHTQEKPFKCQFCYALFSESGNLNKHLRKQHAGENTPRPHKCEICGKRFAFISRLEKHMKCHPPEKVYKSRHTGIIYDCEVCGKSFSWLSRFQTHMKSHTNERPYVCLQCNARFTLACNLNRHIAKHKGDVTPKPYKCEVCGKTFSWVSTLNIHMRSHTQEKPYTCKHCNMGFKEVGNMNVHIRKKHADTANAKS